MSLTKKFIIYIAVPVVVLFITTIVILNKRVTKYDYKVEINNTSNISDIFSLFIYDKLQADIDILKTLEVTLEKNETDFPEYKEKTVFDILKNILIQNHDYVSVWLIHRDNESVTTPEIFKVSKKNQTIKNERRYLEKKDIYYKTLLAKTELGEKELFISNYNKQNNIITVSVPFKINFIPSGVCSIDININEALNEFNKKYVYDNSSFFILSENEDFINSPKDDILKNNFIQEFEKLKPDFNVSQELEFSFYSEDELYFSSVKQISFKSGDTKWTTATLTKFGGENALLKGLNSEILFMIIILLVVSMGLYFLFFQKILTRIKESLSVISAVAFGRLKDIKTLDTSEGDEVSDINNSINKLNDNLDKTANYIEQIYKGNINFDYKPVSEDDKIGNLTLELAKNIKHTKEEEAKRKREEEIQNWITKGSALFAEIIRDYSDNLEELSYAIISKLVKYIEADQGGIFVINENEKNEKYIELLASYAYDRRKMLEKRIPWGAGLVGRCILERETIFMTKIPENYLNITSGLGKDKPQTLLIVPLIFHEEVYGVVELASFKFLDEYKITLTEQVSESIASAISMVKINARTAELLRETKIKSEQSASQEEEIRQNIEEMQAVTDGLNHKLAEVTNTLEVVKKNANIAEFDTQGRITDINDNYLKILKKNKQDIIGKVQGSFSKEAQNPESFKKFWDDLRNGKTKEFTQIIQIEGKQIKISSTYYPVKDADGNVFKVVSIANIKEN